VETDEDVKKAAIEFWCTIAYVEQGLLEEERELAEAQLPPVQDRPPCRRYTESAMESLVPLLLETLTKQEEDVEADVWNLQAAGATCLECISSTVEGKIVLVVMPFVQANIANPDWRMRDAAIVAFASILDGPETEMIANYIIQAAPVVLRSFQDAVPMVRDSSVHCISKICKLHMGAIPPDLLQHVLGGLTSKLREPSTIAAHACSGIFNIAQSFKHPDGASVPETNFLSPQLLPVLQALLAASDREDSVEGNLRVSAMSSAAELVGSAAKDTQPILREFLPEVLKRMETAMQGQVVSKEDAEQKEILVGLLCALVTVLFQSLSKEDVFAHVDRCLTMLLQALNQRLIADEALLSIGAIAGTMEDDFTVRLSRPRLVVLPVFDYVVLLNRLPCPSVFLSIRSTCRPSCPS
jgi:importin subunit beta-1